MSTGKAAIVNGLEPGTVRSVTGLPVYYLPLGYLRPPLSLNDRGSWRAKARKVKELRVRTAWRARALIGPAGVTAAHIHVQLTYVPPDRRDRDPDNLVATLKPCIDALTGAGVARGWPCYPMVADDTPAHVTWAAPKILEPDVHGGRLWLTISVMSGPPGSQDSHEWLGMAR